MNGDQGLVPTVLVLPENVREIEKGREKERI